MSHRIVSPVLSCRRFSCPASCASNISISSHCPTMLLVVCLLCTSAIAVPSFTLRTVLSATPVVSERWWVPVLWFHRRSSQSFINYFGSVCVNSFRLLLWTWHSVSDVSFVFHQITLKSNSWNHLARSEQFLCPHLDSFFTFQIVWPDVITSPTFVQNAVTSKRFFGFIPHLARVVFVFSQTSRLGSFG